MIFNESRRLHGFINYNILDCFVYLEYIFMKYGLTDKQLKLFNFIKDYINKNITSPSYQEMMIALDLNSKCTISAKLKQLEERGWIEKMNGKNRSIRVTEK